MNGLSNLFTAPYYIYEPTQAHISIEVYEYYDEKEIELDVKRYLSFFKTLNLHLNECNII